MPSPVTPAQFKAILPDPNSGICGNFLATLIQFPSLLYQWFAWAFSSVGNFSKQFINGSLPPGSLVMSACLQTEDGTRLLCDGREVAQSDFPDLFAAIGLTYGTPSSSSLFKIPNYSARFPCGIGAFPGGASASIGTPGGEDLHILKATETPVVDHTHGAAAGAGWNLLSQNISGGGGAGLGSGTSVRSDAATGSVTGGPVAAVGHNCLPPFLGCYIYLIC